MRLVSLLPSATEMICGLGLGPNLVGVSHECDFPAEVGSLPKVTRTNLSSSQSSQSIDELVRDRMQHDSALYTLDCALLSELRPDLIVTQTLCDVCAVSETDVNQVVRDLDYSPKVIRLEPTRLDDVLEGIRTIGIAAGAETNAVRFTSVLQQRVEAVSIRSRGVSRRPSAVILEWVDPLFCAGHWNPELVQLAGAEEMIGQPGARSRAIDWQTLMDVDPEVLVIACCGFDLARARQDLPILISKPGWERLRSVRGGRVYLVDGSAYFNRPGPRLVDSLEILAHALHPAIHSLPIGLQAAQAVVQPS